MTDPNYAKTREILKNATPDNIVGKTAGVTGNFEAPKVINDRRGAVMNALRLGPAGNPGGDKTGANIPPKINLPPMPRPNVPSNGDVSAALSKHGEALRKMFGHRGPQRQPGELGQEVMRREPGSLLRAADQRQASALKHEITGSASLHVKLASGLAPVSGVKTKGSLFKEIRLDRAPQPLANTTG